MPEIKLFPGTTIRTRFINSPSYAPVFLNQFEKGLITASVNAGNSDGFFVLNSGGINMSFDKAFQAVQQYSYRGPDPYVSIHRDLFINASQGVFVRKDFASIDPLSFALIYRPLATDQFRGFKGNDGTIFVDIFKSSMVPNLNNKNYAMLYVCPPYGPNYTSDNDFLQAIKETSKNLVKAVRIYNDHAKKENILKGLETLRMCLFSSGLFNRQGVSVNSIANYVFEGLKEELRQDSGGILRLEFENGLDPKTNERPYDSIYTLSSQWKDPSR